MNALLLNLLKMLGFSEARIQATREDTSDAISLTEVREKINALKTGSKASERISSLESQHAKLKEVEAELAAAKEKEKALTARFAQVAKSATQASVRTDERSITELRDSIVAARVRRGVTFSQAWGDVQRKSIDQLRLMLMVENRMEAYGIDYTHAWNAVHNSPDGKKLLAKIRAK